LKIIWLTHHHIDYTLEYCWEQSISKKCQCKQGELWCNRWKSSAQHSHYIPNPIFEQQHWCLWRLFYDAAVNQNDDEEEEYDEEKQLPLQEVSDERV
jgi:hypothetical protein